MFSELCTSNQPVFPPLVFLAFGSLPCLAETCSCDVKSTSCIDLSACRPLPRPRVLLKAPTLAEMEEMNLFEASFKEGSDNEFLETDEKLFEITHTHIHTRNSLERNQVKIPGQKVFAVLKMGPR